MHCLSRLFQRCRSLDPIPEYSSEKIRALRDHLQLSQAVLAAAKYELIYGT